MTQEEIDEINCGIRETAAAVFSFVKRRVASRRERVILLSRAAREALDVVPIQERAPGFVTRTWELPEISASAASVALKLSGMLHHCLTLHTEAVHSLLLTHAVHLALGDLSPDERAILEEDATKILGTRP